MCMGPRLKHLSNITVPCLQAATVTVPSFPLHGCGVLFTHYSLPKSCRVPAGWPAGSREKASIARCSNLRHTHLHSSIYLPAWLSFQIPHLKRGHIEDCGHWTQMDK